MVESKLTNSLKSKAISILMLAAMLLSMLTSMVGISGDWYKIIYNGGYSYVYAKYAA